MVLPSLMRYIQVCQYIVKLCAETIGSFTSSCKITHALSPSISFVQIEHHMAGGLYSGHHANRRHVVAIGTSEGILWCHQHGRTVIGIVAQSMLGNLMHVARIPQCEHKANAFFSSHSSTTLQCTRYSLGSCSSLLNEHN